MFIAGVSAENCAKLSSPDRLGTSATSIGLRETSHHWCETTATRINRVTCLNNAQAGTFVTVARVLDSVAADRVSIDSPSPTVN